MKQTTERKEGDMKTCTARLERERDGRWTIELEEEERVHTWGKTIDQALARIREAAALWYQVDDDQIEIIFHPVLPKTMQRNVERSREYREQARNVSRQAVQQTQKAAAVLTESGITMRDAAAILGISYQRVHQLLSQHDPIGRKAG
jgi:predicted RNase H-like HicB family nuclease